MSYAPITHAERESTTEHYDAPPLTQSSTSRPLSLVFEEMPGEVAVVDPSSSTSHASHKVGTLLKSFTSSAPSYEMIEDDDYEEELATPRGVTHKVEHASTSEQSPVRTASVSRHLPLKHPTPDLQSMQGAYLKNVERLEESAERLSMTSSLEDELQRVRSLDRQRDRRPSAASSPFGSRHGPRARNISTTSLSNSIIGVNSTARSGGYSPSAYITSPTGSIRSSSQVSRAVERRVSGSSRLGSQLPEPELEGRPLDMVIEPDPPAPAQAHEKSEPTNLLAAPEEDTREHRSASTASRETSGKDDNPFGDFDGVHFDLRTSLDRDGSFRRRLSLKQPPLARDSRAFSEAQPGESMIYYPAPVPVMLNLPTRLSRQNFSQQQQRRLKALSGMPDEMRKSAAWLANEDEPLPPGDVAATKLPPQLRASAFFDQPSTAANLQLQNGSAVQTLDSILDAAAHAPVSAFTDHPIAGRVGKEVYGPEKSNRKSTHLENRKSTQLNGEVAKKRRSSLSNILKSRKSSSIFEGGRRVTSRDSKLLDKNDHTSGDEVDAIAAQSIAPGEDELLEDAEQDEDELRENESQNSESDHQPGFSAAPTTLLAELQVRKAQQKERNRTAADAFPNGMHSTLLEMDAVTQLQQKSRRQKHVALAWEDHDAAERENFDDDDVPLGILFPEKDRPQHLDFNRPIGLMERREMEDNEPLSHRRARLRGESFMHPQSHSAARSHVNEETGRSRVHIPSVSADLMEEAEEETLAQRVRRIKEEKEKAQAGNHASDAASQFGLAATAEFLQPSKTPDAEETLGQRRKRLKEEALKNDQDSAVAGARPALQARHSMADLLQAHPVGVRQVSGGSLVPNSQQQLRMNTIGVPVAMDTHRGSYVPQIPGNMANVPYYSQPPYMHPGFNASQNMMYGGVQRMAPPLGMNMYGAMMQDPMMGPPLNSQQRAVIDRWRQGIA